MQKETILAAVYWLILPQYQLHFLFCQEDSSTVS